MRNLHLIPICLVFVIAPFSVLASGVVINEVMFDPEGSDTGVEWIELYNGSNEQVDISGWEIYPDGIGYIVIPNGFLIGAKKFILVHLRITGSNSATDIYQATASSNMSNTSGSIALFGAQPRGKDTIKSFIQWGKDGETWEPSAGDAGLWDKGTFVDISSFSEGSSLALSQDGVMSGGKNAWRISHTPSPQAVNTGASASNSPLPSPFVSPISASSVGSPLPSATPHASAIKTIKAYAGQDVSSMVGSVLDFFGHSKGINDEAIDSSARFFWNFGDGETQEGRNVAHTYRVPGIYLAGLHISSGEYAASDYIRLQIGPNLVSILGVVWGDDGHIRLTNGSDIEADISGWNIRDSKQRTFIFPPYSKMARRGDIAIRNSITGLLKDPESLPIRVLYPNGVEAFTFSDIVPTPKPQRVKEEQMSISHVQDLPIATSSKKISSGIAPENPAISFSPVPTPYPEDSKSYAATAAHTPFVSIPFVIVLGTSVLGAVGFLIAKQFSR
ncbi:MAG: lamin tail domain-containing protein [Patescibacteria group bacterium]